MNEAPPSLAVGVVIEGGDWTSAGDLEALVGETVRALARTATVAGQAGEATIAFDTDATVRRLNRDFRGHDKPTNVLSFPTNETGPAMPDGVAYFGDVVLAAETVVREAAELGIAVGDHVRHLVLHGLLHLFGYDHQTEADASVMESLETTVLARLGVADPYGEVEPAAP